MYCCGWHFWPNDSCRRIQCITLILFERLAKNCRWPYVVCQEADIAAGPLTVTSTRERVVDQSKPLWVDQIVAIMKRRHASLREIHTLDDLAGQSAVRYGVLESGATEDFFQMSMHRVYARMWGQMDRDVDSRVRTVEEGLQRVMSSTDERPWAFIGESSMLNYAARGRCDLEVLAGGPLPIRPLALAMPLGSFELRAYFNVIVLELRERGMLTRAHAHWFNTPFNPIDCNVQPPPGTGTKHRLFSPGINLNLH